MLSSCTAVENSSSDSTISENNSISLETSGVTAESNENDISSEESFVSTELDSSENSEQSDVSFTSEESKDVESSEESSHEASEDYNYSDEDPSVTIESAGERFADKFTLGEVIQTETSYQSANVNVTLKEITFGGKLYFVQDIYIKNIECFSSGFAGTKFGAKYNDFVLDMVEDYRAAGYSVVGAINGDYCNINNKKLIIRDGKLYRTGKNPYTICVLYKNGVMKTIPKQHFDAEAEIEKGAWHAWDFGPSFLAEDGSALTEFTDRTSISGSNPRTVIGYFEPGHYCFITIGGRNSSNGYGVTYKQMSAFASDLGCKVAYNLDGGDSAVMVFGDKIVNQEYQGTGRPITDIIFISDVAQ